MEELSITVSSAGESPGSSLTTGTIPIYSPTDTQDWSRCALYRKYKRRYQERGQDWNPNMPMGTVLDHAMKTWWQGVTISSPHDRDADAMDAGLSLLASSFQENPDYTLDELRVLFKKGLKVAIKGQTNQPGWEYWAEREKVVKISTSTRDPKAEGALVWKGQYVGTPDLITRDHRGLIVTDLKNSLYTNPIYLPKRLAEYDTNTQGWHYAYFVSLIYGEPVVEVRFQNIVMAPSVKNVVAVISITPERLNFWFADSVIKWSRMAQEGKTDVAPGNWENCYGKYGKCPFYMICHELDRDPEKIKVFFEERKES